MSVPGLLPGLIVAPEFIVTAPVVSSYLTFDAATQTLVPAQRALFDLPIGPAVALFFALSAVAHFTVAFPARRWYERARALGAVGVDARLARLGGR